MALISVTYKFPPSALNATRKETGKAKKKKSEQKLKKRRTGDIQVKGITLKCKRHHFTLMWNYAHPTASGNSPFRTLFTGRVRLRDQMLLLSSSTHCF